MKLCSQCNLKYPVKVIQPLISSEGNIPNCCPLCAANIVYGWIGSKRSPFSGKWATQMFDLAFTVNGERWKQKNKP